MIRGGKRRKATWRERETERDKQTQDNAKKEKKRKGETLKRQEQFCEEYVCTEQRKEARKGCR